MTLFLTRIDRNKNSMEWVTAGHDPAFIYDTATDAFIDLKGKGLALGVMENAKYSEAQRDIIPGQIIIIATDGLWEARSPNDKMFGKDRLYKIIRQNASATANEIQGAIFEALKRFRKDAKLEDDMTLVVVKVERD